MSEEARLREDIVRFARSLFERGLTPGSSGNLSARLDNGEFLCTPTNASLGFLEPERLSRLDAEGDWLDGDEPTKEVFLHMAMYRANPGFRAVAHLHSTYSVCLACMPDRDPSNMIEPMTPYVIMRVGAVARANYRRPGDQSLGPEIEMLARDHAGILIDNHGPLVGGKSLRDAVFSIEEVEEAAKLEFLMHDKTPRRLSDEEVNDLQQRYRNLRG
ncbi:MULTISPECIES: aldolase [unclassified Modicisalibacter]|uniref:3-oxo-tetronate 4-phosphate decarboxylase n=1 Tax=unclassified Modicisalibacter TaxID=2679913 RepID=UPI001CCEE130|nr:MULTISPECIES: aldolase [unclassified Modicisalibacter]MBZ9559910.1 aldolase [Modicisalibacter sp. R2A 31.J]MBZ9575818.1 aldolase [Modicisalibacter sp. MOD 31.J]